MIAYQLATARLALTPVATSDYEFFFQCWNDPQVGEYLWDGQPVAPTVVHEQLEVSARSFATCGYGIWRTDFEELPVGFVGLRPAPWRAGIEILYGFTPRIWGQGIATEAAAAVLRYGLSRVRLPEIYAGANPANPASLRVLEKLGMERLGVAQSATEPLVEFVVRSRRSAAQPQR